MYVVYTHQLEIDLWYAILKKSLGNHKFLEVWQFFKPGSCACHELCIWCLFFSGIFWVTVYCVYIKSARFFQELLQQPYQSLSEGIVSCNEVVFAEYNKIISRSHCLHFRDGNALTNKCKILRYQNVRSVPLLLKKRNKQKKKKEKPVYFWWSSLIY